MCPALLYLSVHVLKVFYEQINYYYYNFPPEGNQVAQLFVIFLHFGLQLPIHGHFGRFLRHTSCTTKPIVFLTSKSPSLCRMHPIFFRSVVRWECTENGVRTFSREVTHPPSSSLLQATIKNTVTFTSDFYNIASSHTLQFL